MNKPDMEELFSMLPDIPEDFNDFCRRIGGPTPVFYRRIAKGHSDSHCICGRCGHSFMSSPDNPVRGEITFCQICNTPSYWEWKTVTAEHRKYYTVLLAQCLPDHNLAVRFFSVINIIKQGHKQELHVTEIRRAFFWQGGNIRYNRDYNTWSTQNCGTVYMDYLYPGYKAAVQDSVFRRSVNTDRSRADCFFEDLVALSNNPGIEIYRKIGMTDLARDLVMHNGISKYVNRKGKDLKSQLRLDQNRINRLRKMNGDLTDLKILQIEKKTCERISDEEFKMLRSLFGYWSGERSVQTICRYMSIRKMLKMIAKYADMQKITVPNAAMMYSDYLNLREELGYDMTNTVFLFPRDLKMKHDEMVEENSRRKDEIFAQKSNEKYSAIAERFEDLEKIYGYEADGLTIRPAMSAGEIIAEGRTLHHCVGSDRYLRSHNDGRTSILMLRHKEKPGTPYYTIEIKGREILQWYGIHDSKPDKEVIGPWLDRYVQQLDGIRNDTHLTVNMPVMQPVMAAAV